MPPWFCLAMDLALVSGQRREDLTQMRFSHIVDGRLQVEQGKTEGFALSPLDLELKCMQPAAWHRYRPMPIGQHDRLHDQRRHQEK